MHAWGRAAAIICLPSSKWFPAFTEIVIIIFKSNIDDVHAWLCNSNSAVAVWAYVPCVVLRFRGEKHGMLIEKAFSTFEVRGFFSCPRLFTRLQRFFSYLGVLRKCKKSHQVCRRLYFFFKHQCFKKFKIPWKCSFGFLPSFLSPSILLLFHNCF